MKVLGNLSLSQRIAKSSAFRKAAKVKGDEMNALDSDLHVLKQKHCTP